MKDVGLSLIFKIGSVEKKIERRLAGSTEQRVRYFLFPKPVYPPCNVNTCISLPTSPYLLKPNVELGPANPVGDQNDHRDPIMILSTQNPGSELRPCLDSCPTYRYSVDSVDSGLWSSVSLSGDC